MAVINKETVDRIKRIRKVNNVLTIAVETKTKDGFDIETYVSKHLGVPETYQQEFIDSMSVLFDSKGYYKERGQYQRFTDAFSAGYVHPLDKDIGIRVIQVLPGKVRTVNRNHPEAKAFYRNFIDKLVFTESQTVDGDDNREAINTIHNILAEDTGQRTITESEPIPVSPITEYNFEMTLSKSGTSRAGFVPGESFGEFLKKEKPEILLFKPNTNPKLKSKIFIQEGHARLIIELW